MFSISQDDAISEISEISEISIILYLPKLPKFLKFLKFPTLLKTFDLHCYVVIERMEISEISVISFFGNLNIPRSVRYFSIEFYQNCFGLRSEVPSRDLNGDRGN